MKNLLSAIYKFFSRYYLPYKIMVKIRNQANIFIGFHFAQSHFHENNGEQRLIEQIKSEIKSFIDIGANKGDWTKMVVDMCGVDNLDRIYMIEPSSSAYEIIAAKYTDPKVKILKTAISDFNGRTYFYEEPGAGETSSLNQGFSNRDAIRNEVDVTTIDSLFSTLDIKQVDLLKIDCEGYDYFVLKGATDTLSSKKAKYIQFEYNDGWQLSGGTLSSAIQMLTNAGYHVYAIRNTGIESLAQCNPGDYFRYSNFFASYKAL